MIQLLQGAVAAVVAATAVSVVPAQTTTPTPTPPPSVAQLCAATGVAQVDGLLDAVADTQLVGALAPLLHITVPDGAGVKLAVDLDKFRDTLHCDGDNPTATPTPTTPPPPPGLFFPDCGAVRAGGALPLLAGEPGYRTGLDSDGDGIACEEQVLRIPLRRAETGDGSLALR